MSLLLNVIQWRGKYLNKKIRIAKRFNELEILKLKHLQIFFHNELQQTRESKTQLAPSRKILVLCVMINEFQCSKRQKAQTEKHAATTEKL